MRTVSSIAFFCFYDNFDSFYCKFVTILPLYYINNTKSCRQIEFLGVFLVVFFKYKTTVASSSNTAPSQYVHVIRTEKVRNRPNAT